MDPFNARFILQEKRWQWIDYDKGISIILVGYGHCWETLKDHGLPLEHYPFLNYIGIFLYGFRMPLFFIVSGLIVAKSLNKKGFLTYLTDRTNNILYPLLIWGVIQVTLQILMARLTHNGATAMDYINLIIAPRRTGIFWYLNALFCIGVIYAFLKTKLKVSAATQVAIGLSFYIASYFVRPYNPGAVVDILEYYFFFALGDLLSGLMLNQENMKRYTSWKVAVPLLAVFLVLQYYATEINLLPTPAGMRNVEVNMPLFFMVQALIGCALSICCSFFLQKYQVLIFLRIVGFHSLFIYCVQIITMTLVRTISLNYLHITNVPALVAILWGTGIVLPIFFYNFCLRYNLWWLYTYRKPSRHIEYIKTARLFNLWPVKVQKTGTSRNVA